VSPKPESIPPASPYPATSEAPVALADLLKSKEPAPEPVREIGGRSDGTDPTRFGDWEKNGRCIDF
jgi:hypothetical protein